MIHTEIDIKKLYKAIVKETLASLDEESLNNFEKIIEKNRANCIEKVLPLGHPNFSVIEYLEYLKKSNFLDLISSVLASKKFKNLTKDELIGLAELKALTEERMTKLTFEEIHLKSPSFHATNKDIYFAIGYYIPLSLAHEIRYIRIDIL